MTQRKQIYSGVFIAEGSSDMPLSDLVEELFFERGIRLYLSKPDFRLLGRVAKDVRSRMHACEKLVEKPIDLVVVHRDADNAGPMARRKEMEDAIDSLNATSLLVPIIPIRMTEAWLLLDETAIRVVAGNPRGRTPLNLPKIHEVETQANPKAILESCLLKASEETGRRRERVARRFDQNRRQLLERLDRKGPVGQLPSWKQLITDVEAVVSQWC